MRADDREVDDLLDDQQGVVHARARGEDVEDEPLMKNTRFRQTRNDAGARLPLLFIQDCQGHGDESLTHAAILHQCLRPG